MLRELKSKQLHPHIYSYRFTSGASPTWAQGQFDATSITNNGTGDNTIVPKYLYSRAPIVVATPGLGASAGGFVWQQAAATASVVRLVGGNASGTAEDKVQNILTLGWKSSVTDIVRPQNVVGQRKIPRLLCFTINTASGGSFTQGGGQATLSRTGTGDVTVTFRRAFADTPLVLASAVGATVLQPVPKTTQSSSAVRIQVSDTSGVATDASFNLVVYGFDTADETSGQRRHPVQVPFRAPRIMGFRAAAAGGSLTIGSGEASIAKNGTGDYTITFGAAHVFARAPFCIPTAIGAFRAQIKAQTSSTCRVLVTNAAGTAQDQPCDVIVIGSDDAAEYFG